MKHGHDRDGLRRRECHVIEGAALALFRAIAGNAIRAVALPEELSSLRVETLPYGFKILGCYLSFKPKQFSAVAAPPAFDSPILVVVIALPKVPLGVALTAGHGTNRQHSPTLALFEIRDQPVPGLKSRTVLAHAELAAKPISRSSNKHCG